MYRFLISGFGVGFLPVAPGTWGSAVVAGVFILCGCLGMGAWPLLVVMAAVAIFGAVVTLTCGGKAIRQYGQDPSVVVSDEFCGQAVTYLWLWHATTGEIVAIAVAGFVLFRVFDIVKPWPSSYFDKMKNVRGILLDDVVAGVYASIVLQIVWHLGWLSFV